MLDIEKRTEWERTLNLNIPFDKVISVRSDIALDDLLSVNPESVSARDRQSIFGEKAYDRSRHGEQCVVQ